MGLLQREQLDAMAHDVAVNGCRMPGCGHESHEPIFFIHARCHIYSQCDVRYMQGHSPSPASLLFVHCGECDKYICRIPVKQAKAIKRCHVASPVEVSYREGTGIVGVACSECKSLLAELEVE